MSPDADAILALPEARHPKLIQFAQRLANHSAMTLATAREALAAACRDLAITRLDIEHLDATTVPFQAVGGAADPYAESVRQHIERIARR